MNIVLSLAICAGGWLVPGFGHILLGRRIRGMILAFCIFALFVLGLSLQGKLYFDTQTLYGLALFADAGMGLPYLAAMKLEMGAGLPTTRTYDYGTVYMWVAGLLNYLIILDAFDISQGRKP